ncbi:DUF4810 domain-containing protein [Methylotuvimicrobium alcaliphilum]|uniref:Lipoprotein n=1 Tax=Methylotuvimicrobium alcaliphilum (strain DSM 19304 / NCIMB 14124 / VKM B-2133 / 20Z) TaxID=1091494 RepID=G4SUR7_META2|nr:DUF4810 domain-containing protein [Methylotuvimicrobium alcaliphilum]CCE22894.1 protein of unknown function [Methylotuvimicrobium alcaliphilum 20Z]
MSSLRVVGWCVMSVFVLAGCAPQGLYYWGAYEDGLYDRYVENSGEQVEAYLRQSMTEAEASRMPVPPGLYADYGFVLYQRGDKAGAIDYFRRERELYPESTALMNKLIERIEQQDKSGAAELPTEELAGEER